MGIPPSFLGGLTGGVASSSLSDTLKKHYSDQMSNVALQQQLLMQNLERTGRLQQGLWDQQRWNESQQANAIEAMMNSSAGNWYHYKPKLGELNYVADRNNEWADRDREARRVLRDYWSLRVGDHSHYKNLNNFDDFLSNLEIYLQSNPEFIPVEEVQQKHGYYLIEQANLQALRGIYKGVAERTTESQRRIIEVGGILTAELGKDQRGDTCTQRFIDQL